MPGVAPDDARVVMRIDRPAAGHGHIARAGFDRDQRHRVVMLVLVGEFGMRVLVIHVPFEDFLPLRFLGRQPQALEAVDHRRIEAVTGGMADREAHQARNR